MIIVKLMGGLGNQMFQYAAGRALSLHHNCSLKLDLSFLLDRTPKDKDFVFRDFDLDIFNMEFLQAESSEIKNLTVRSSGNQINSFINKLSGKKKSFYRQPGFQFDPAFFSRTPPLYMDGYWQSEKFFKPYETYIRNDFTFRHSPNEHVKKMAQYILENNAVCVNVRRGDFLNFSYLNHIKQDYYKKAEKVIAEKINDPVYFIFSDDIDWCKNNLQFKGILNFVEHIYAGKKFFEYLYLMTLCKYFVIPNSSFGWWAAWLNNKPDKIVIAPKNWFHNGPKDTQDIIPEGWMKIL